MTCRAESRIHPELTMLLGEDIRHPRILRMSPVVTEIAVVHVDPVAQDLGLVVTLVHGALRGVMARFRVVAIEAFAHDILMGYEIGLLMTVLHPACLVPMEENFLVRYIVASGAGKACESYAVQAHIVAIDTSVPVIEFGCVGPVLSIWVPDHSGGPYRRAVNYREVRSAGGRSFYQPIGIVMATLDAVPRWDETLKVISIVIANHIIDELSGCCQEWVYLTNQTGTGMAVDTGHLVLQMSKHDRVIPWIHVTVMIGFH